MKIRMTIRIKHTQSLVLWSYKESLFIWSHKESLVIWSHKESLVNNYVVSQRKPSYVVSKKWSPWSTREANGPHLGNTRRANHKKHAGAAVVPVECKMYPSHR